jgi:hypothetical protein
MKKIMQFVRTAAYTLVRKLCQSSVPLPLAIARDAEALGGDLAYQYNLNGTLAGIGWGKAQKVVANAGFRTQAQALQPLASLREGRCGWCSEAAGASALHRGELQAAARFSSGADQSGEQGVRAEDDTHLLVAGGEGVLLGRPGRALHRLRSGAWGSAPHGRG